MRRDGARAGLSLLHVDRTKLWRKQLYERQPYPDNHVDPSFHAVLDQATTTPSVPLLLPLMKRASAISLPISSTFILLAVFISLLEDTLAPTRAIWVGLGASLAGYFVYLSISPVKPDRHPLRETIVTLLLLHSLSPILRTLTEATTSDSIWPLAGVLFALGLLLTDYSGSSIQTEGTLSTSLSLTSRLSGSVVLASRLPSNSHVFAFVLSALILFALVPLLVVHLKPIVFPLSLAWFALALTLLVQLAKAPTSATLFLILQVFVVVVGPGAMVWSWDEKSVIRGDWDVARPIVRG